MKRTGTIVLSTFIGISCQVTTQPEPIGERIDYSTVILSSHLIFDRNYDRTTPELLKFDVLSDIQSYLSTKSVQEGLMDSIAREDFGACSLLLLLLQWQGTGMVDVTIDSVLDNGYWAAVYATRLLPPPERPVTHDIGFPCHIIRIPKVHENPILISVTDRIRP
jgi:hypothetical protein